VINQSINGFDTESRKIKAMIFPFSSDNATLAGCHARIGAKGIDIITKNETTFVQTTGLKALLGNHNQENIAAAILACLSVGADIKRVVSGLNAFKNLAHRIKFIKTIDGISFYDDSKATNTDAVIRAMECFKKNIILILGGREKGTDFSLLVKDVSQRVKTIIAIGESTAHVKDTFNCICPVKEAPTMKDAVQTAFDMAQKKDIVLLSPACASFDMYDNYAHRGNDFANHVNGLGNR
jgi:UDP-N-acetylmuramoylalanine--D-glutamate ligase